MSKDLNPQKALIFRITHRDNIPWALNHGLHCRNSNTADPKYVEIGNPELIGKRHSRDVPEAPYGTLSDYIPFYFTPFSPMMFNIKTGYNGIRQRSNDEIVILVGSLHTLLKGKFPFLFTDRHAYLRAAQFYSDLAALDQIDWQKLQERDFKRDPENPEKVERYQAEALIYKHLPIDVLTGIVCYNDRVRSTLDANLAKCGLEMKVIAQPKWYFS